NKLKVFRKYFNNYFTKGFIKISIFSIAILIALLILFILKKNKKLRLCINYRYLNKAIVKNYYLILLILKLI
ncbi:hypothetical protein K469DRAFT_452917, partial [Zopfia rhizophila CBS 207.26]